MLVFAPFNAQFARILSRASLHKPLIIRANVTFRILLHFSKHRHIVIISVDYHVELSMLRHQLSSGYCHGENYSRQFSIRVGSGNFPLTVQIEARDAP